MKLSRAMPVVVVVAALLAATIALDFAKAGRPPPEMLPEAERADRILVEKSTRRMMLLRNGEVLREYSVALGGSPVGDKEREGDGRTPSGRYLVDFKNDARSFSSGKVSPSDQVVSLRRAVRARSALR